MASVEVAYSFTILLRRVRYSKHGFALAWLSKVVCGKLVHWRTARFLQFPAGAKVMSSFTMFDEYFLKARLD